MQTFLEHVNNQYPRIKDIRTKLRMNWVHPIRKPILDAFIVGSEAKGVARPDSDLDVAIIIPPIRGKTALQFTEQYHSNFTEDNYTHFFNWNGRKLDIQFFYPDDPELQTYSKIQLKP